MTIEFTVESQPDATGEYLNEWEIERYTNDMVRQGMKTQAELYSAKHENFYCSGRFRNINTTVTEGDNYISYMNTEPLTVNNTLSMWNNMARDVNVFDDDWQYVKAHKELLKPGYSSSVFSLPELDAQTFRGVFNTLREEYRERSTTLLWSSLRSSVCNYLSSRIDDNLYDAPDIVAPEPF